MNSRPNMVENQCGLIDRTQSMAMKVTLNPRKSGPGRLMAAMVWPRLGAALAIFDAGPVVEQEPAIRIQPAR